MYDLRFKLNTLASEWVSNGFNRKQYGLFSQLSVI